MTICKDEWDKKTLNICSYDKSVSMIAGHINDLENRLFCFTSNPVFNGDITIGGNLNVEGDTFLQHDLLVSGDTQFLQNVLVDGNLEVLGDFIVKDVNKIQSVEIGDCSYGTEPDEFIVAAKQFYRLTDDQCTQIFEEQWETMSNTKIEIRKTFDDGGLYSHSSIESYESFTDELNWSNQLNISGTSQAQWAQSFDSRATGNYSVQEQIQHDNIGQYQYQRYFDNTNGINNIQVQGQVSATGGQYQSQLGLFNSGLDAYDSLQIQIGSTGSYFQKTIGITNSGVDTKSNINGQSSGASFIQQSLVDTSGRAYLQWQGIGSNGKSIDIKFDSNASLPQAYIDVTSADFRIRTLTTGNITIDGKDAISLESNGTPILGITNVVQIKANITANTGNAYDIGSNAVKFKDLYLSGNADIGGNLVLGGGLYPSPIIATTLVNIKATMANGEEAIGIVSPDSGTTVTAVYKIYKYTDGTSYAVQMT